MPNRGDWSNVTFQDMDSAIRPLTRSRLVDSVTEQLRDLILGNAIAPGTQLLQIDMAERLGVSRTPLREAFRILEREGLVRVSNGNNTIEVVDFTVDEIREYYELREVLDGLAARLAAKRGLPDDIAETLEEYCQTMQTWSGENFDPPHFYSAHSDFHTLIVRAAGNSQLEGMSPFFRMSTHMLARRMGSADEQRHDETQSILAEANNDHLAIYEAIKQGDARAAEAAARRHIRKSLNSWIVQVDTTVRANDPSDDRLMRGS